MPKDFDKNLIRRYLVWCYKTTKEDLDRIDRYFTQNTVDQFILDQLEKDEQSRELLEPITEFAEYMTTKLDKAKEKKFRNTGGGALHPQYLYLTKRFQAIEKAIKHFLGKKALKDIAQTYEEEFTRRIWEAREHT